MSNHIPASSSDKLHRHGIEWQPSPISSLMWYAQVSLNPLPYLNADNQDDIDLHIEIGGNPENRPLVLIMGLGSQLIFWTDEFLIRLINAGFYVIRFDNRDIGLSSKIKRDDLPPFKTFSAMFNMSVGRANSTSVAYTLPDMADDVARLILTLNIQQPFVLGASMGGMIAQILTAKYPHLVSKLALLFTTNNRPFLAPIKPKQLHTLIKRPASHAKDDVVAHSEWFIGNIGSQGHYDATLVKDLATLRYERCFYPLGTVQQMHAILATGSMQEFSHAISVPTLIMHGTEDGLVPFSQGKALAKDIKGATFVPIEGMAHDLPSYYQPFIVRQLKEHFLGM